MILLCSLAAESLAGEWRDPKPYIYPVVNISLVSVNGQASAQAAAGAQLGVRVRYSDAPHWLSHTRTAVVGFYGLNTGSLGADVRLGSFIGPDGKLIQYQVGPDLWAQGYGARGAEDYWLPWTPGIDLRNMVTLKIAREFQLVGEVTPGWVFDERRQSDQVPPFHQLTLAGMGVIRTNFLRLTVGYSRQYTAAGTIDGLILSGAL
jgi:hypothetical protein